MKQSYSDQLNLNYLRVFDAIYKFKSTSRAASALGISQSAVSQTLSKLRYHTGDRLFYMSGNQLIATYKADIIGQGLSQQIALFDSKVSATDFSDPQTFSGHLNIAVSSVFMESIATELTSTVVFKHLPKAKLNITTWNEKTLEKIETGEIQIGLNFYPIQTSKSIRSVPLTESKAVIVARKNHPWIINGCHQKSFNNYTTGGILVPGLAQLNAVLERHPSGFFSFQYRSASMSVLSSLCLHSDLLVVTENLSASMCNDQLDCLQPKWLETFIPESMSHAIYYSERNHNHPLYRFCCNIVKDSLVQKLHSKI